MPSRAADELEGGGIGIATEEEQEAVDDKVLKSWSSKPLTNSIGPQQAVLVLVVFYSLPECVEIQPGRKALEARLDIDWSLIVSFVTPETALLNSSGTLRGRLEMRSS